MKKIFTLAVVLSVSLLVFSLSSCKKKEEPKKEEAPKAQLVSPAELAKFLPKLGSDLQYDKYSTTGTWLQVNVQKKGGKERAMWFQVFDQRNDQKAKDFYNNTTEKVAGKYPAIVAKDMHVWILVNNIEIRLIGDSKAYKNTAKLTKFLESFDLAGLEKL